MDETQIDAEVENLVETLALEPIEVNLFRGLTSGRDGPRIFGGHVIAQALMAAYETVEDRICHSLHCYFIRPGDPAIPILYDVDRARDGSSFTTRRVRAIQHGEQIFNLAGSFQHPEEGLEHQDPMPDVPMPDHLADESDLRRNRIASLPPLLRERLNKSVDITPAAYDRACATAIRARAALAETFEDIDVLLTFSAPGAAPKGLDWTGDPRFNRLWTLMGVPCVNVPAYVADGNLPVGVQVIARFGDDAGALAAAWFVEQALRQI